MIKKAKKAAAPPVRSLRADMKSALMQCLNPDTSCSLVKTVLRRRLVRLFLGVYLEVEAQDANYTIAPYEAGTKLDEATLCKMLNGLDAYCRMKGARGPLLFTTLKHVLDAVVDLNLVDLVALSGNTLLTRRCAFVKDANTAVALAKCPLSQ
jgi:hypothetical protein